MDQFIIRIDLSKYFSGDKAKVVVLVDSKWGTVQRLKEHIEGMFQLKDVELKTTDGCWIPLQENINLLRHIDLVEAYSNVVQPNEENHMEVVSVEQNNGNTRNEMQNFKRKLHTIDSSFASSTPCITKKNKVNNLFMDNEPSPVLCQTAQLDKTSISAAQVQAEVESKAALQDSIRSLTMAGIINFNENSLNRKKKRRNKNNKNCDSAVNNEEVNPSRPSNNTLKPGDKPKKHTIFTDDLNNEGTNSVNVSKKEVEYEFLCGVPNSEKFIVTENAAIANGTLLNNKSMQIEEISTVQSKENKNENVEALEENINTIDSKKGKRFRNRSRKNKKPEDDSNISSEVNRASLLNATCETNQQKICIPALLDETKTADSSPGFKEKTTADLCGDIPHEKESIGIKNVSHNSAANTNCNDKSPSPKVLSSHNETSFSVADDASLKDSSLNQNILGKTDAWSTEEETKDSHSASKNGTETQTCNANGLKTNSISANQSEKNTRENTNSMTVDEANGFSPNREVNELDNSVCEEVSVISYQQNNETSIKEEVSCLEDECCSIIALDSSDDEESNINNSSLHKNGNYSEQESKETLNLENSSLKLAEMKTLAKDLNDLPNVGDHLFFKLLKVYKNKNIGTTDYMTGVCEYVNKRSKCVKVKLIEGECETEFIPKTFFSNLDDTDDRQNLIIKMEEFIDAKIYSK